ncbi:MAG TPA: cysteine desulfurase NifS [Oscillospiraceae bacterium]|jgi:cysteine desulfurase|nr:cysteine desulfurase NifS [Oscillospiraceae bacterium]
MQKIYVDNAATTAISPEVLDSMLPFLQEVYGNPSSMHSFGQAAAAALEKARADIADILGAQPKEIYFTSGGSESDNWAINAALALGEKKGKKHIVSSKIEHHAVLHVLERLEKEGYEVTYLDVYENGIVRLEDLEKALRDDTALVTIMYANNEIGSIQPIAEIGALCRKKGVIFHTDAVQAVGHLPVNVKDDNIDMLSLSAHKFHGPKGVGILFCRTGIALRGLIIGGAQERSRRAGTENVAGIVGMATALKRANENLEKNSAALTAMKDKLIAEVLKIPRSRLNGDKEKRLPGNISFCFEGIEGEALLLSLDMVGIAASSGSACTSGSLDPSHVLLAIGLPHEIAHGSLRISLSEYNTLDEMDYIIEQLPIIVQRLRNMSPVWEKIEAGGNL